MFQTVTHFVIFGVEFAALLACVLLSLVQSLPQKSWVAAKGPIELRFRIKSNQPDLVKDVAVCRVYYASSEEPNYLEKNAINVPSFPQRPYDWHSVLVSRRLTQLRIDFYLQNRSKNTPPPIIEEIVIDGNQCPVEELVPSRDTDSLFAYYNLVYSPRAHGWMREVIVVGVVLWGVAMLSFAIYYKRNRYMER